MECNCAKEANNTKDKKLLWIVLSINFGLFVIGITAGLIANSMGLVADSLDELADAIVYGLAIYAISGSMLVKKRIARFSAIMQTILACWGFYEIVSRFVECGEIPNFTIMIIISCVAVVGNAVSLYFLNKSNTEEVHIKATQIFTANDVIVNLGVILAAILVAVLQTKIPDLVIGAIVFAIVLRGAIKIFRMAR